MKLEFSGLMYLNFNNPTHKFINDGKIVDISKKAFYEGKPMNSMLCEATHAAYGNIIQHFYKFNIKISYKDNPAYLKLSANYLISFSTAWAEKMLMGDPGLRKEYEEMEKIIRKEIVVLDGIINPIIRTWGIDGQFHALKILGDKAL